MRNAILVSGYAGFVKRVYAKSLPRLGYWGTLYPDKISALDAPCEIGGSAYRVLTLLHQLKIEPIFCTLLGSGATGTQILEYLKSKGINVSCVRNVAHKNTPYFIEIHSNEGLIQQYHYDELTLSDENGSGFSTQSWLNAIPNDTRNALIMEGNISCTQAVLGYCRDNVERIVWLPSRNLYEVGARCLLECLRSTHFLIITPDREYQICTMLGLNAISQVLEEGLQMIIKIQNGQDTSQFTIYTHEKIPTHQLTSLEKYHTNSVSEIEEKFAVGFSAALTEYHSSFEAAQWGVVASTMDFAQNKSASTSLYDRLSATYKKYYG